MKLKGNIWECPFFGLSELSVLMEELGSYSVYAFPTIID